MYHVLELKFFHKKLIKYFFIIFFFFIYTDVASQNSQRITHDEMVFQKGLELLDLSNYVAARKQFENYLNITPTPTRIPQARFYIVKTAIELYHTDAESLIKEFQYLYPNTKKSNILNYELAKLYFREDKFNKAIKYYLQISPNYLSAFQNQTRLFNLGYSYFSQKEFDFALPYFDSLSMFKNDFLTPSNYYSGYINYTNGEYEVALNCLEKAREDEQYALVAPELMANIYYKLKKYDDLITYGNTLIKDKDEVPEKVYLLLGEAHFEKKNYHQAMRYYSKFEQLNKKSIDKEVIYKIGYLHYKNQEYVKSIDYFKNIASSSDSIGIKSSYYLGISYLKTRDVHYAKVAFDVVRKNNLIEDLKEEATYQLAKIAYDMKNPKETEKIINQYFLDYPNGKNKNELNELLSEVYLDYNNYDLVIDHINTLGYKSKKVLRVYQYAAYMKGAVYFNQEQYQNAIKYFLIANTNGDDQFLQLKSSLWLAESYAYLDNFKKSVQYYKKTLSMGTNEMDDTNTANYGLAYVYYNNKEYNYAITYFLNYLKYVKNKGNVFIDANLRLADCYYAIKKYQKALETYNFYSKQNGFENDYAYLQIGIIYGILQNVDQAVSYFNKVIKLQNSFYIDNAIYKKGLVYYENGKYAEAIDSFDELLSQYSNSKFIPYAHLKRGSAYFNQKLYKNAIDDYQIILENYPTNSIASEVLILLQEVLDITNQSERFEQYVKKYKQANPNIQNLATLDFESAKKYYFNFDYELSVSKFKEFLNQYPDNKYVEEARYFLAESYYRISNFEDAMSFYNVLITNKTFDKHNRVIGRMAEIEFSNNNFKNAIYFFHLLKKNSTNAKEEKNALIGLISTMYYSKEYDSTIYYSNFLLSKKNIHSSEKRNCILYKGKSYFKKNEYDKAKKIFQELIINENLDFYGVEAKYYIGKVLFEENNFKESIKCLLELNQQYVNFNEWVGESFLLLAENYLALEDDFQAIETLKSIKNDFPQESIRLKAENRLNQIQKLEEPK